MSFYNVCTSFTIRKRKKLLTFFGRINDAVASWNIEDCSKNSKFSLITDKILICGNYMIKIQEWYLGLRTLESQKHLLCFILLNNTSIAFIRIMKKFLKQHLVSPESITWKLFHSKVKFQGGCSQQKTIKHSRFRTTLL